MQDRDVAARDNDEPRARGGAEAASGPTTGMPAMHGAASNVLMRSFLGLAEAVRWLFPIGRDARPRDAARAPAAIPWIVPLGLAIGLSWAGVFRATWKLYGEIGNVRVVPALVVVVMECLLTGPFLAMGLARTIHLLTGDRPRRDFAERHTPLSPVGTLILVLTVLSQWSLIASIPWEQAWWPSSTDWRHHFNFVYPAPLYRPLLLAPIWGRWGILLAASIGRTGVDADPATVALCRAMSPWRLIRHAALPLVLTAIYCSRSRNFLIGVIVGLLVFAVTYGVAVVMAWRGGGQTRQSLFASGQVAQLAFLAIYRAFWPVIHG